MLQTSEKELSYYCLPEIHAAMDAICTIKGVFIRFFFFLEHIYIRESST